MIFFKCKTLVNNELRIITKFEMKQRKCIYATPVMFSFEIRVILRFLFFRILHDALCSSFLIRVILRFLFFRILYDSLFYSFFLSAERQNEIHQQILKRAKNFDINDIVGYKIANVDRSNTAPSILPCKIIDIVAGVTTNSTQYRVATEIGIITGSFAASDLSDLNETLSSGLRQLDCSNLPSISIIQACQSYTNYRSVTACKCVTACNTARCPCKKRSVQCCSKCHRGQKTECKNSNWTFRLKCSGCI